MLYSAKFVKKAHFLFFASFKNLAHKSNTKSKAIVGYLALVPCSRQSFVAVRFANTVPDIFFFKAMLNVIG